MTGNNMSGEIEGINSRPEAKGIKSISRRDFVRYGPLGLLTLVTALDAACNTLITASPTITPTPGKAETTPTPELSRAFALRPDLMFQNSLGTVISVEQFSGAATAASLIASQAEKSGIKIEADSVNAMDLTTESGIGQLAVVVDPDDQFYLALKEVGLGQVDFIRPQDWQDDLHLSFTKLEFPGQGLVSIPDGRGGYTPVFSVDVESQKADFVFNTSGKALPLTQAQEVKFHQALVKELNLGPEYRQQGEQIIYTDPQGKEQIVPVTIDGRPIDKNQLKSVLIQGEESVLTLPKTDGSGQAEYFYLTSTGEWTTPMMIESDATKVLEKDGLPVVDVEKDIWTGRWAISHHLAYQEGRIAPFSDQVLVIKYWTDEYLSEFDDFHNVIPGYSFEDQKLYRNDPKTRPLRAVSSMLVPGKRGANILVEGYMWLNPDGSLRFLPLGMDVRGDYINSREELEIDFGGDGTNSRIFIAHQYTGCRSSFTIQAVCPWMERPENNPDTAASELLQTGNVPTGLERKLLLGGPIAW